MISQIYWFVPKRILYWKMAGHITGMEICEMSNFIADQVHRTTVQKVHIIIDTTGIQQLDYNNLKAREAFSVLANQDWMGKVATIVRNDQIQIQMNALSSAFGLEWKNVRSTHAAIRSLKESDRSVQIPSDIRLNQPIARPHAKL